MTVGVAVGQRNSRQTEDALEELGFLTQTAGGWVIERALQKRERPDAATFIGKGKAKELAGICGEQGISTVIFDDPLSPAQQRNLEAILPAKVLDRTRLILDIFASRAASAEGSLQVELAQLSYLLPRLTGKGAALSQQVGGIGTRGPGEKKLEVDQRRIRERIYKLTGEIERVRRARARRRERRREIPLPVVALVGYTNAGKSTLLNAFAKHHEAYTDDKLFATLDPLTRRVKLLGGRYALLTDTVGFIRKLPHPLVAAFKATLEEVSSSDLLLQVMDAASPTLSQERDVVESVLEMLSAHQIPRILVYNKADLLKTPIPFRGGCLVSAKTGEGLAALEEAMNRRLSSTFETVKMVVPYARAGALKRIRAAGLVKELGYSQRGIRVEVRADSKNLSILKAAVNGGK